MVLHGSIPPGNRRAVLKQLADWDPVHAREPILLAATASYIGEGFDCPALDTLFLCSPSSSESITTQNVGRIMRDLPGKTTLGVHDYADTKVPMLTRMHGKRLTAYGPRPRPPPPRNLGSVPCRASSVTADPQLLPTQTARHQESQRVDATTCRPLRPLGHSKLVWSARTTNCVVTADTPA